MNTTERRLMAIRVVRLEQLLKEACHRLAGFTGQNAVPWPPNIAFLAQARAALEPTCMACGGAPCACEKGAES